MLCLQFAMLLIRLLAVASEGKNHMTETQCHSVVHEVDLAHALCIVDGAVHPEIKVYSTEIFLSRCPMLCRCFVFELRAYSLFSFPKT